MFESYTGSIFLFAGNFAPQDWMLCQGQLLNVAEYQGLFNVIGATYGGDGVNTFALPDYRNKMVAGANAEKPLGSKSEYFAGDYIDLKLNTVKINYIICVNGIQPQANS